jgi:hypothetical protein
MNVQELADLLNVAARSRRFFVGLQRYGMPQELRAQIAEKLHAGLSCNRESIGRSRV